MRDGLLLNGVCEVLGIARMGVCMGKKCVVRYFIKGILF